MLLNELQKQNRHLQQVSAQQAHDAVSNVTLRDEVRRQTEENRRLAGQLRQLAEQVVQLRGMFEQTPAAQRGVHNLAAAFDR